MTLRILQFGGTGQVGRELLARAKARGAAIDALWRSDVDLTDARALDRAIKAADVDVVVNAAAYTAVDRAESEAELCFAVNAAAPEAMARACAARDLPLVHLSTDYVFSGEGTSAWAESDPVGPRSVYGATKLAGEEAVAAAGARATILRTSWVFSPYGSNFVKTMLRLVGERKELRVVDDQVGRPTYAGDIAEAVLTAARRLTARDEAATGLFHFAGEGPISWHGFAQAIIDAAGLHGEVAIVPISTDDYPTAARRPAYSVLDTAKFSTVFGEPPRPWTLGLAETLTSLRGGHA